MRFWEGDVCGGGLCIERLYIMMPRVLSEREASEKRGASAVLSASEIGAARYETGAGGAACRWRNRTIHTKVE